MAIATMFLGQTQLYAADFHIANIDIFDANYVPVPMPSGAFRDPRLRAGYAPFNVFGVGTFLFVSYALQDDKSTTTWPAPAMDSSTCSRPTRVDRSAGG